jgi:NAD(P)-dependent dehydrogenase (short-subunit alcohol dehydrogenase family)
MKADSKHAGMLENKVAVIYGAGGAIGAAVARAFAEEGARVFLTGRRRETVEDVAREIVSTGGFAEAAEVDALDSQSIDQHLEGLIDREGRLDVSFNAVGTPCEETLGVPLIDLDLGQFLEPINSYLRSYYLTARLAARRMLPKKTGVIMTVTALHSRMSYPLNGGYGPAQAAKEALTRSLSGELAPHGIRVVGLRPHGIPETPLLRNVFEIKAAKGGGMTWEQFQGFLAATTHSKRCLRLAELAGIAAFMASDRASGMTGTNVNLSMGTLDD